MTPPATNAPLAPAGWTALLHYLDANPLVPGPVATIPMAVREDVLPELQMAHAAGMSTALGTRMSYSASDPVSAAVLATYFNQGLQHGLHQRLAALQTLPIPIQNPQIVKTV